jgi:peptide/nickel transport system ATP-binding protein
MTDTTAPVLEIDRLEVDFRVDGEWAPAVRGISFTVGRGEVVALVGESGSGKSVTSMSVLGLLPPNSRRRGSICLAGKELLDLAPEQLRKVRGQRIAMVFQEPMTALNPVMTVGAQIAEAIQCHRPQTSATQARQRAIELLAKVGIPEPGTRVDSYPHQLSGGQRQRAMIAMAISNDPEVIIADEPTTALDVTVQAEILELLRRLQKDLGAAVVLITHDMGVVADLADRVVVMKSGDIVETAPAGQLFLSPEHAYTRKLLAAVPRADTAEARQVDATAGPGIGAPAPAAHPVLRISDLDVVYRGRLGRAPFKAVHRVSLEIGAGKVLGLVGESGSGKSTIGRAIAGLVPASSGLIEVCGQNIAELKGRGLRTLRRRYAMVFQDPGSSLNPRESVGDAIAAPMIINRFADRPAIQRRVHNLLEQVELPRTWAQRYPHELSGGQRQRIGIARALALEPELLIADEPTSALDVSVQATVLRLFQDLQQRLGFSCLFISHDLAVVELLSDEVAVLRHGRLVEAGPTQEVLRRPTSDYTARLIAAAPVPDPVEQAERRRAWQQAAVA